MNSARVLCFLMVAGSLSIAAAPYGQDDVSSPKLRVEWAEFKKLYDAGKIAVVDVRGGDAYRAGHIPGARNIPVDDVEEQAETLVKLGKPIVAYCS